MDEIDRRDFLIMSSAGAAALGAGGGAAHAATAGETREPVILMHGDGLDLSPADYAQCLAQLVAAGTVHSDYYSQGGSVETLEKQMAEHLGKESAIFLPTGTLANLLAVRQLAGEHGRVIVQEESHLYNDSGDGLPTLSRLQVIGLVPGKATFSLGQVQAEVERAASGKVRTPIRTISIESPVRRLWGQTFDFEEMKKISAFAAEQGIGLHLDGARLLLAESYTGVSPAEYASLFDTVYVSLWKYLNAGSGAILAGSTEQIDDLFHARRMFGGSLIYGWVYAAVAGHYLPGFSDRFGDAVRRSEEIYRLLSKRQSFEIERVPAGTNVVKLKVSGIRPEQFRQRLRETLIDLPEVLSDGSGFKIQVNETWNARAPEEIAETMIEAAS